MVIELKEKIETSLLTPQQLLDKFERLLSSISKQYSRKGLKKDDAYQQAYLELLEIYLQYPEITDDKLVRKVYDKLRNYYRREIPKLTYRELLHLDAQLPIDDIKILKAEAIPQKDLKRYAKIYRYFPNFMEIAK